MTEINQNREVMRFFPDVQNEQQTQSFMNRMNEQFKERHYCYFAAELIATQELIGFIGISYPRFSVDFELAPDLGWRLSPEYWGKGLATEGAKSCIDYAFNHLNLNRLIAICPAINTPSENVMKKIGMNKIRVFNHPLLLSNPLLEKCLLYQIENYTN